MGVWKIQLNRRCFLGKNVSLESGLIMGQPVFTFHIKSQYVIPGLIKKWIKWECLLLADKPL